VTVASSPATIQALDTHSFTLALRGYLHESRDRVRVLAVDHVKRRHGYSLIEPERSDDAAYVNASAGSGLDCVSDAKDIGSRFAVGKTCRYVVMIAGEIGKEPVAVDTCPCDCPTMHLV
jgi:hypothetical protein